MGSIARMSRAKRFIEHFAELLVPKAGLVLGETITVASVQLAPQDGNEGVMLEVVLHTADGSPLSAVLPFGNLFSPDYDSAGDVEERLSDLFNIDPQETHRRLVEADLI
jgi:hypothetical protein